MNNICQTQAAFRIVPNDLVVSIDATDNDNELSVTEYIDVLCFVLCPFFIFISNSFGIL